MNRFLEVVMRWWMQRNKVQKLFLAYLFVALILLTAFPILSAQDLDAVDAKQYRFFGSGMIRLQIVVGICFIKLIGLTTTTKWKKNMYTILGWNNNDHLDNAALLGAILLILLTVSEVISFYSEEISSIVQPTRSLVVIELLLLGGIIRQVMLTRMQRKKSTKKTTSTSTKVTHEVDDSHKENIFSSNSNHQDRRLEGFFGDE